MQVPVHVVLKGVAQQAAVREEVIKAATGLERFHDRVTACSVSVTNPDTRHRTGSVFDVHVVLSVPGRPDIVVSRRAGDQPEREHVGVSLRKAFKQARRRLQDTVRERRGDVKTSRARTRAPRIASID